ncbi:ribonuclease P [Candidatus Woesearchaeota archaeon]|nr:ribonuclease P [Candidatus Woesearchaeota archaeon]
MGKKNMRKKNKSILAKKQAKSIAAESIRNLFSEARKSFEISPQLSDRNVNSARRIAMKAGIRIPSVYRRQFCRYCYAYLLPGKNCRVRTNKKTISYFCTRCRRYNRISYKGGREKIRERQTKSKII